MDDKFKDFAVKFMINLQNIVGLQHFSRAQNGLIESIYQTCVECLKKFYLFKQIFRRIFGVLL